MNTRRPISPPLSASVSLPQTSVAWPASMKNIASCRQVRCVIPIPFDKAPRTFTSHQGVATCPRCSFPTWSSAVRWPILAAIDRRQRGRLASLSPAPRVRAEPVIARPADSAGNRLPARVRQLDVDRIEARLANVGPLLFRRTLFFLVAPAEVDEHSLFHPSDRFAPGLSSYAPGRPRVNSFNSSAIRARGLAIEPSP